VARQGASQAFAHQADLTSEDTPAPRWRHFEAAWTTKVSPPTALFAAAVFACVLQPDGASCGPITGATTWPLLLTAAGLQSKSVERAHMSEIMTTNLRRAVSRCTLEMRRAVAPG
jgi:hypothetical protein